jgi:hypothetical protein
MSRAPCTFRQRDVTRALRAARAAGVLVDIRIDRVTGDLVIKTVKVDDTSIDTPTSEQSLPEDIVL